MQDLAELDISGDGTYRADSEPIWVAARQFGLNSGTASLNEAAPIGVPFYSLPDAATSVLVAPVFLPSTWTTFTVDAWFVGAATATGSIIASIAVRTGLSDGDTGSIATPPYQMVLGTAHNAGAALVVTATVADKVQVRSGTGTPITNVAGEMTALYLRRFGADGSDTLNAAFGFLGYMLRKAS